MLEAADGSTITSLCEPVWLRRAKMDVDTKTFAENVLGTWDIQRSIVRIEQVAASKTTFTVKPLLVGWTNYLIDSIAP